MVCPSRARIYQVFHHPCRPSTLSSSLTTSKRRRRSFLTHSRTWPGSALIMDRDIFYKCVNEELGSRSKETDQVRQGGEGVWTQVGMVPQIRCGGMSPRVLLFCGRWFPCVLEVFFVCSWRPGARYDGKSRFKHGRRGEREERHVTGGY